MLRMREPALCNACHAGAVARKDVARDFQKTSAHPLRGASGAAGRTLGPGRIAPACSDCHEPHRARTDLAAQALGRSPRLDGALRVRVTFGMGSGAPVVSDERRDDRSAPAEYEVCFRCHAGGGPAGSPGTGASRGRAGASPSIAALLSPANASFHPVVDRTRAPVPARTLVTGTAPARTVTCSDCHGGDEDVRGPHGSTYAPILRRPLSARGDPARAGELCFACHVYSVYGDPSGGLAGSYSRFPGHAAHVARGAPCGDCHDAHGSATWPALLVARNPGLVTVTTSPVGATCTTNCHVTTALSVTYRSATGR
jgi:predicted CXXCH cytochrome family protein